MATLQGSLRCGLSYSHRYHTQSRLLTTCLPLDCLSASTLRFSTCKNLQVSHYSVAYHVRCTASTNFNATVLDYDHPLKDEISELPPLIPSMAIAGLPPPARASAYYEAETENQLMEIAKRWQVDSSFKFWIPPAISWSSFVYSGTVSLERFVAISYTITLGFVLDDLLIDSPNDSLLEAFGIDRAVRESPTRIAAFLNHLCVLFQRDAPLAIPHPTPIEGMMWESGQQIRRLSNPEWFGVFSEALVEHFQANVTETSRVQDVETYIQMRVGNSGAVMNVLLQELALDVFLTREIRVHPTFQQLLDAAILHMMFVNDVFSYPKEVVKEPENLRNLMRVMVECEGVGVPQAAWRTVEIVNGKARTVVELEKQLLDAWGEENGGVCVLVDEVKAMMAGNLYWHGTSKRYRHPESVFPELRDCWTAVL